MDGKIIFLCIFGAILGFAYSDKIPTYDERVREVMLRNGYKEYEKIGYYKYHVTPAHWIEAMQICIVEGAHLAVPKSQEDVDRLVQIYRENPRSRVEQPDQTLLGFTDLMTEGKFVTVLGGLLKNSGYSKWRGDQPDGGTYENCGTMFSNGLLNDFPCHVVANFICEREILVPNPDIRYYSQQSTNQTQSREQSSQEVRDSEENRTHPRSQKQQLEQHKQQQQQQQQYQHQHSQEQQNQQQYPHQKGQEQQNQQQYQHQQGQEKQNQQQYQHQQSQEQQNQQQQNQQQQRQWQSTGYESDEQ